MEQKEDEDQEHEEVEPRIKISPIDILKQQMKQKEQQIGRVGAKVGARLGARRSKASKVFKEPLSAFGRECQSHELLPDAPPDVDQLE